MREVMRLGRREGRQVNVMRVYGGVLLLGLVCSVAVGQTRPAITPAPVPQATTAPGVSALPTGANATPGMPQVSADSYVIGPGDQLALTVWKEPTLSNGGIPVRPDGRISVPLLGDVPAAGMTPMSLGRSIADRLKQYITDPLVTVTMLGVAPKEIFFIGEVGRPGPIILTPGMNILQAIAEAGGLSPYAKKKLYILRKSEKGQQKLHFDYKKALNTGDMQGITLMAGDTIVSQ